jgi:hypothetical protein
MILVGIPISHIVQKLLSHICFNAVSFIHECKMATYPKLKSKEHMFCGWINVVICKIIMCMYVRYFSFGPHVSYVNKVELCLL